MHLISLPEFSFELNPDTQYDTIQKYSLKSLSVSKLAFFVGMVFQHEVWKKRVLSIRSQGAFAIPFMQVLTAYYAVSG